MPVCVAHLDVVGEASSDPQASSPAFRQLAIHSSVQMRSEPIQDHNQLPLFRRQACRRSGSRPSLCTVCIVARALARACGRTTW